MLIPSNSRFTVGHQVSFRKYKIALIFTYSECCVTRSAKLLFRYIFLHISDAHETWGILWRINFTLSQQITSRFLPEWKIFATHLRLLTLFDFWEDGTCGIWHLWVWLLRLWTPKYEYGFCGCWHLNIFIRINYQFK